MRKSSKTCKKQYFNNLNFKNTTDTKNFCTNIKTLFSNKIKTVNSIVFHENQRTIKDKEKTSHTLNKYFTNRKRLHFKKKSKRFRSILIAKKNFLFVNSSKKK